MHVLHMLFCKPQKLLVHDPMHHGDHSGAARKRAAPGDACGEQDRMQIADMLRRQPPMPGPRDPRRRVRGVRIARSIAT